MTDNYAEQFKLLNRAKKLEEQNQSGRALELYLELHENYNPNTSDAFLRPIVLLEKKGDYKEALILCNKAIDLINDDKISGTTTKFEKRKEFIEHKLEDAPKPVKETSDYKFGIVGFRSNTKTRKIVSSVFYILFIILGIIMKSIYTTIFFISIIYMTNYFADLLRYKHSKKEKNILLILFITSIAIVIFSGIFVPRAFNKLIELEEVENENNISKNKNVFKTDNLPTITESDIENAINDIKINIEVLNADILLNGSELAFILTLDSTVSKNTAMDLSEEFINSLSHIVSIGKEIKPPTTSSHGELYEYYNLTVGAGYENNILVKGKKSTTSKYITWIESITHD